MSIIEKLREELAAECPAANALARLEQHGREIQGIISVSVSDDDEKAPAGNTAGSRSSSVGVASTAAEGA